MSQTATLKLNGCLEQGFNVILDVSNSENIHLDITGHLPANPKLLQNLDSWRQIYRQISANTRITVQNVIVQTSTLSQIETCRRSAKELESSFRQWLESADFQGVEEQLRSCFNQEEDIRVLIDTRDVRLRKLPWHLWDFIEKYEQSEIAFTTAPGRIKTKIKPRKKVRVLAILGSSQGINTQADRKMLKALPNAKVTFLVEPSRQQINDQLWNQSWDIFFFAGHSETNENQGRIYINSQDSLTLDELKYGLRRAIKNGLQLAIFNSCDGLGLAAELEQLYLPQLIVMREPVPDQVAHQFLKNFLDAFARGEELYVAAREAREKLQGMEDEFLCASWLPIIFQNPTFVPPTYSILSNPPESDKTKKWRQFVALFATSMVLTGLVMGVRFFGMLQELELPVYDTMMLRRPQEPPDNNFVIIEVTEDDFKLPQQKNRKGSLSDEALYSVLNKLNQYKPRVIALDIFRDESGSTLANYLQQDNFIGACFVGNDKDRIGVSPAKYKQIGYTDVSPDTDNIMRRAVLAMAPSPKDRCQETYSLSFKIAKTYLEKEGKEFNITSPQGYLQLGNTVFKPLGEHSSGYQKPFAGGHQILINYRSVKNSPLNLTDNVFTLEEVLSNTQKLDVVKDKIVLIGTNAASVKDHFSTPYNQDKQEQIPGVRLHATIASQIINAVLYGRPLLGVWSIQTEVFWVWGWSLLGGLLVWGLKRAPVYLVLAVSLGFLILLYHLCYAFLAYNYTWIPFVPAAIVFGATAYCLWNFSSDSRLPK